MTKVCTKCYAEKDLSCFHLEKRRDGHRSFCKECTSIIAKKWRIENREAEAIASRIWYENNKERKASVAKIRVINNREKINATKRKYYAANKEKIREKRNEWNKKTQERRRTVRDGWRSANRDRIRETDRRISARRRSTVSGKLNASIGIAMCQSLNGTKNGRKWETLVNYNVEQLKMHLEKQFLPGMSWDNYGKSGWHIDHKIPISAFNYEKPGDIDFKRCWELTNLRPMWAIDNIRKRAKVEVPFQPALAIGG